MSALSGERCRGRGHALGPVLAVVACILALAACATTTSYQTAAMEASDAGDQKKAVSLATKEVARFATPDQCSRTNSYNCGTLALAYSTLAQYQILDGDRTGGERSFSSAKGALGWTEPANRPSATAIVYRDVSEAYWKMGDRARAIAVFKEGRAAGGDQYLYMSSAARAAEQSPAGPPGQAAPTPSGSRP